MIHPRHFAQRVRKRLETEKINFALLKESERVNEKMGEKLSVMEGSWPASGSAWESQYNQFVADDKALNDSKLVGRRDGLSAAGRTFAKYFTLQSNYVSFRNDSLAASFVLGGPP